MSNQLVYLNTAGTGLLSSQSIARAKAFMDKTLTDSSTAFLEWLADDLPRLRKNTAQLFDTTEDQVAFTPNFSFALSAIAQSLEGRLKRVLLYQSDYPSLNLPFELGDFELHYVKSRDGFHISTDEVIETIDQQEIEVVALSHVQFLTGFKLDIQAIGTYCKDNGVVFIVDGTQSMGATTVSFGRLPVDVLIGSSYKWLNGGFGSAITCIRSAFIERFPPRIAGFGSIDKSDTSWNYRPSYKSFEPGHMNAPALLQLQESVQQKLENGLENIYVHNTALTKQLHEALLNLPFEVIGKEDAENRLHILVFKASKDIADALVDEGFALTWRKETIRVSPHFYNTAEDIDAFIDALKKKI